MLLTCRGQDFKGIDIAPSRSTERDSPELSEISREESTIATVKSQHTATTTSNDIWPTRLNPDENNGGIKPKSDAKTDKKPCMKAIRTIEIWKWDWVKHPIKGTVRQKVLVWSP